MKFQSNNKKRLLGLLLLFFVQINSVLAQFPYELKPGLDYGILGLGAVSLTTGQVLKNNASPYTESDINSLNTNNINSFDKPSAFNYSEKAETTSNVLLYSAMISPVGLLLDKELRRDWITLGVMGLETFMISYGVTNSFKASTLRARPYAYNNTVSIDRRLEKDARYSFFSAHVAVSSSMTFFAAKVYADTHPNSKWKPLVWSGAVVLPALTAWASIEAGQHFPTDVVAGFAVGAAIGYFIPVLHLKNKGKEEGWLLQPNMNGLALKKNF